MKLFNIKIAVLIITILFGAISSSASTYVSCTHRSIYESYTKEDGKTGFTFMEKFSENSVFIISETEEMFVHKNDDMVSSYYVGPNPEYNDSTKVWTITVTSDVGNEYLYMFDFKNKIVKALIARKDKSILVMFHIKAVFSK